MPSPGIVPIPGGGLRQVAQNLRQGQGPSQGVFRGWRVAPSGDWALTLIPPRPYRTVPRLPNPYARPRARFPGMLLSRRFRLRGSLRQRIPPYRPVGREYAQGLWPGPSSLAASHGVDIFIEAAEEGGSVAGFDLLCAPSVWTRGTDGCRRHPREVLAGFRGCPALSCSAARWVRVEV